MIKSSPQDAARVFDVASLALSFEEIAVDVVRGETTEFLSRWYRSKAGDADLTIWWDSESRVVKQQLCMYGQVVEWNPIHGTRTGLVIELEMSSSSQSAGAATTDESENDDLTSETIQFDAKAEKASVDQALSLVKILSALKEADRSLLAYNFRESPRLHKNARERAIRAWAPQSEELLNSTARSGLWKSVSRWIFGK